MIFQHSLPERAGYPSDSLLIVIRDPDHNGIIAVVMKFPQPKGFDYAIIFHYTRITNKALLIALIGECRQRFEGETLHILLYEVWTQPKTGNAKVDFCNSLCGEVYPIAMVSHEDERSLDCIANDIMTLAADWYKDLKTH